VTQTLPEVKLLKREAKRGEEERDVDSRIGKLNKCH